jgi:hypothetical protein
LYDDSAPQATVQPIVSQAAVFVLANMLNRDLPPLVFQTPLTIEDMDLFEFDAGEMGAVVRRYGFDRFAEPSSDEEDYWGRRHSCANEDKSPWPAHITAKHLIGSDEETWISCADDTAPTTRIGTMNVKVFTKHKEYVACYCGCDGNGPLPSPRMSKPYERMSTAVFEPVASLDIPAPTVVFEDSSSGHIWFDLEPYRTSTFHHAACTGGYRVLGKTEVGTVRYAVRCTMKFVLQPGGLLCIVARPHVVM